MTRRLLIRLALAVGGMVVVAAGALTALIVATSAPQLPPPPLPTVTAQPATNPAAQLLVRISASPASPEARTRLTFADSARPQILDPPCTSHARWSLTVNPEDVVGRPYATPPAAQDWARAASAVATANGLCPAPVVLTWYGHDLVRPASDAWTAQLPPPIAVGIDGDGPALRRYALRHARQM